MGLFKILNLLVCIKLKLNKVINNKYKYNVLLIFI